MTPPPERDFREESEKLDRVITDCMNCNVVHAYQPGNERCFVALHLKEALKKAFTEGRNQGIEMSAEIAKEHECSICENHCGPNLKEEILSLKSDTGKEKGSESTKEGGK